MTAARPFLAAVMNQSKFKVMKAKFTKETAITGPNLQLSDDELRKINDDEIMVNTKYPPRVPWGWLVLNDDNFHRIALKLASN